MERSWHLAWHLDFGHLGSARVFYLFCFHFCDVAEVAAII
jgi:hypothetical protein